MICYLTSSPTVNHSAVLNPANGFTAGLYADLPAGACGLFITSSPDDTDFTDHFADGMRASLEDIGITFRRYDALDRRNQAEAAALVSGADLIILAGGHVPTQNRFFAEIGLRELMHSFNGVVMGISAGTMNSADTVYAQPELDGEAADPNYQRFIPGLGLTETMLLPHYQMVKDNMLDGLRLFEDVTYSDSIGRCFYAMPDGTYLYSRDGREELRGTAYRIADGVLTKICDESEVYPL